MDCTSGCKLIPSCFMLFLGLLRADCGLGQVACFIQWATVALCSAGIVRQKCLLHFCLLSWTPASDMRTSPGQPSGGEETHETEPSNQPNPP